MTVIRRAEIDLIGFDVGANPESQGTLAIRWAKLTYDDDRLIARENHRAMLNAGDDIDAAMAAVDADLIGQGFAAMPAGDVDLVKAQAGVIWTPEIVAAVAAKRAADAAEQQAWAAAAQEYADKQAADAAAAQEQLIAAVVQRQLDAQR